MKNNPKQAQYEIFDQRPKLLDSNEDNLLVIEYSHKHVVTQKNIFIISNTTLKITWNVLNNTPQKNFISKSNQIYIYLVQVQDMWTDFFGLFLVSFETWTYLFQQSQNAQQPTGCGYWTRPKKKSWLIFKHTRETHLISNCLPERLHKNGSAIAVLSATTKYKTTHCVLCPQLSILCSVFHWGIFTNTLWATKVPPWPDLKGNIVA